MCAGAIVNSRIDRVVYGGADIKAGAVHSIFNVLTNSNLNHQTEVTAGVLEDRCCGIMRDFFKMRREQNKKKRQNTPQSCEKIEKDTCTLEKE
jgi:tRNA(adenine34) deaminase